MGKYSRQNTSKKKKLDTNDIFAYEKSIFDNRDREFSYIIGSDETGRGSIAGPVVTASCCILTLTANNNSSNNNKNNNNNEDKTTTTDTIATIADIMKNSDGGVGGSAGNLIKDSKQLSPMDRERIYELIVNNPQQIIFSVAQRSNTEIDNTNNILTSTMECFQESIEELTKNQLFPYILSSRQQQSQSNEDINNGENNDNVATSKSTKEIISTTTIPNEFGEDDDCNCYSIVDGKKAPKLTTIPSFPCRPMVKADEQVITVALASIIAKVTLDRMALEEWHEKYPEYDFQQNLGYATRDHIEAIHRYGPCPLHRMTFKSLKGR
jgi:ribonuclease HII